MIRCLHFFIPNFANYKIKANQYKPNFVEKRELSIRYEILVTFLSGYLILTYANNNCLNLVLGYTF